VKGQDSEEPRILLHCNKTIWNLT